MFPAGPGEARADPCPPAGSLFGDHERMSQETQELQKDQEAADVSTAIDGELRLLDPAVRLSRSAAEALLDPEFVEVGASGKRWTYEEMVDALPVLDGGGADGPRFEPSAMTGVVLAPGLVHLTYETVVGGSASQGGNTP